LKLETEVELVQNPALCALVIWTFVIEFFGEAHSLRGPTIPFCLPVLPMVIHRETVETLARRHFVGGLHLALAENRTLTIDLQERMEATTRQTMAALNLGFASGLFGYDRERGQLVPKRKTPPVQPVSEEVREMLNTAKRLGFWFYTINAEQLCSILRIRF